jgi:hypothetical protein
VFSLPLLLFVQHCGGIVVVVARQARGDRSGARRRRPLRYAGSGDADRDRDGAADGDGDGDGAAFQPAPRDGIAESAADLRTVLRHLARRGFSSPGQTALLGGSHGGLSLGLAATRHPELFAAAAVNHGLFDLLRYQLFNPPLDRGDGSARARSVDGDSPL